jgi:hypothetical protein
MFTSARAECAQRGSLWQNHQLAREGHDHPVRDARALASNWLSPLLALEVASRGALHFSNDPVKSADFRFWHKADILVALSDVRFWG